MDKLPKIVVTGGAGYIGSVLVRQLLRSGYYVSVIDDLRYGGHGLAGVWEHPHFQFHKQDIRKSDAMFDLLQGTDVLVHLAAIVGRPACFRDGHEAWEINYGATCSLLKAAESLGVNHFIFASTCSNYGVCDWATEDTSLNPLSVYSQTKVKSEKQVLSSDIPVTTVLRFATAYGFSPRMRFDLLLNEFVLDALHEKLLVYGKNSWRPLVHVSDIARAIELVIETSSKGIFNVGGHNRKKVDIVRALQEIQPDITVEYKEGKEDPRNYRVSFEKIGAELNFQPNYNPEDTVAALSSALKNGLFEDPYGERYKNERYKND